MLETIQRRGWAPVSVECTSGVGDGDSCGVLQATPGAGAGIGLPPEQSPDFSTSLDSGRLCQAVLSDGVFPGGSVLSITVYCYTCESLLSPGNTRLLDSIAERVLAWGGPWFVTGDFNNTPEEAEAVLTQWLAKVNGVIRAPVSSTCRTGRTLDWAIVSASLAHIVESVEALMSWQPRAHRPFRIRFKVVAGAGKNPKRPVRREPKRFPRTPPPLPCRQHPVDDVGAKRAAFVCDEVASLSELNDAFSSVAGVCEQELALRYDCVSGYKVAKPLYKYMGHGNVYSTVMCNVAYNMRSGAGSIGGEEWALLSVGSFCSEYAAVLRAAAAGGVTPGRSQHLRAARRRLLHPPPRVGKLMRDSLLWASAIDFLLGFPEDDLVGLALEASKIAAGARRLAAEKALERTNARSKGYRVWQDEQLRTGASGLHRICRERPVMPETAVPSPGPAGTSGWTLEPLALLERELGSWSRVWLRHKGAKAPWRLEQGAPVGEPLPPSRRISFEVRRSSLAL